MFLFFKYLKTTEIFGVISVKRKMFSFPHWRKWIMHMKNGNILRKCFFYCLGDRNGYYKKNKNIFMKHPVVTTLPHPYLERIVETQYKYLLSTEHRTLDQDSRAFCIFCLLRSSVSVSATVAGRCLRSSSPATRIQQSKPQYRVLYGWGRVA